MTSTLPLGPLYGAQWQRKMIEDEASHPQSVLLLPDAGTTAGSTEHNIYYTLPGAPAIARHRDGTWSFALTLVLSRQPEPHEESLIPLIESGFVAFEVDLSVDMTKLAAGLEMPNASVYMPLFAHAINARLVDETDPDVVLASVDGAGTGARLAFSAALDRQQTLAVLDALNGEPCPLVLHFDISYRALQPSVVTTDTTTYPGMTIVEETGPKPKLASICLDWWLADLLHGLFDDGDTDRYIRLHVGGSAEVRDVPVRLASGIPRKRNRPGLAVAENFELSATFAPVIEPHYTLNPIFEPAHAALTISPLIPVDPPVESMPVIAESNAALFPDRVDDGLFWYVPAFEVVQPPRNAPAQGSPYSFSFKRIGHGADGSASLQGEIRYTLRTKMPEASRHALQQHPGATARPVPLLNLRMSVNIPFRDEHGKARTTSFTVELRQDGSDYIATTRMVNDWVRLAYGALAIKGYQAEPATIDVWFDYQGYVESSERIEAIGAAVEVGIPVIEHPVPIDPIDPIAVNSGLRKYFDASTLTLYDTGAQVQFIPENALTANSANAVARPLAVVAHPTVAYTSVLARKTYLVNRFAMHQSLPTLFPCSDFGSLYLDETGEDAIEIGCQEAFELGSIRYRQYEQLNDTALVNDFCTVYRSLQQVGVFLIVPKRYTITRFGPSDTERAYRPVIYLYSVYDPATGESRCDFALSLQPDIPPYVERKLRAVLAERAVNPVLRYITEIEAQCEFAWSVAAAGSYPITFTAVPEQRYIAVDIATSLQGALQVQKMIEFTGIKASAMFRLPDGTAIQSALHIDLRSVSGPYPEGPISFVVDTQDMRVTNEIETPINVSDLVVYDANPTPSTYIVDRRLEPAESLTVTILPATNVEPLAVYRLAATTAISLTEIRSFIEDITMNVIVINLINLDERGLTAIIMECQFETLPRVFHVELTETGASATIPMTLPLTLFAGSQHLRYKIARVGADGQPVWSAEKLWDLETAGHIVSVTWDLATA